MNPGKRRLVASLLVASPFYLGYFLLFLGPAMLEWATPIPNKSDLARVSVEVLNTSLRNEPHLLVRELDATNSSFYLPVPAFGGRPVAPFSEAQFAELHGTRVTISFVPAWFRYSSVRRVMSIETSQGEILSYERAVVILKRSRELMTTFVIMGGVIALAMGSFVVWLEVRFRKEKRQ